MPRHVVELVGEALNDRGRPINGARVGVIGVAFKPNVRDARNSPAAEIIAGLRSRGAEVVYHDPHVSSFRDAGGTTLPSVDIETLLDGAEVIVAAVGHKAVDWGAVYRQADLVVDTINSSRGHATRPRQVLRLGAGWS